MRLRFFSLFLTASLIFSLLAIPRYISQYQASAQETIQLSRGFFTENKGQWDPNILFVGGTDFGKVAFTPQAIYYQMDQSQDPVQLSFVGAGSPEIEGLELLPHYHNYFIGNDPSKWGIECRNFAQVTYTNIWEGIDLAYFFSPEGLKYEYYVHPGANLQDLQVQVRGAKLLAGHHCLELFTPRGALKDDQLLVYGKDSLASLEASFHVCDDIFSFAIDDSISRNETIVIDPIVYSTYLGGTSYDVAYSIDLDKNGNAYLAGYTSSNDFPMNITVDGPRAPSYQDEYSGASMDAFVIKLDASGTQLIYSTYLSGSNGGIATSIAVDDMGNAFVTGLTWSLDFPMSTTVNGSPAPGYNQISQGSQEAFVIKLNASGTQLLYATYLGGSAQEGGDFFYDPLQSIAIDSQGNAYIAGTTNSPDFPMNRTFGGISAPGYDQTYNGDFTYHAGDVYVVKLNPSGTQLLYSTYLGGSYGDSANSIAIDLSGSAYITGYTDSPDFPMSSTLGGPPAPGYDKNFHVNRITFVTKLSPTGSELLYSTFLGGHGYGEGRCIVVDKLGDAYITGTTYSSDFPMTRTVNGLPVPGYNQNLNPFYDVYVVKLDRTGSELLYSTFLGGDNWDYAQAIAIDSLGNAIITGYTWSADFPMTTTVGGTLAPGYEKTYKEDLYDAFLVRLDSSGTFLSYATFLGGSHDDYARCVALDNEGKVYLSGNTKSMDFPTTTTMGGAQAPGYDQTFKKYDDVFVVKFDLPVDQSSDVPDPTPPHLRIWAEVNKPSFFKGEEALLMVTVVNQGELVATNTRVKMTLPQELSFLRASRYRSVALTPSLIEFELGAIAPNSVQTFQVDVKVLVAVSQLRSIPVHFDVNCTEKSFDFAHVLLQLIPQRSGRPELYLGLYYRNASWDPQTASIYIPQDTPLEIDFVLTGAQAPYELSVDWGDGETEVLSQQTELRQTLRHQFKNKGKKVITVKVTDQLQRSKTATLHMEVR